MQISENKIRRIIRELLKERADWTMSPVQKTLHKEPVMEKHKSLTREEAEDLADLLSVAPFLGTPIDVAMQAYYISSSITAWSMGDEEEAMKYAGYAAANIVALLLVGPFDTLGAGFKIAFKKFWKGLLKQSCSIVGAVNEQSGAKCNPASLIQQAYKWISNWINKETKNVDVPPEWQGYTGPIISVDVDLSKLNKHDKIIIPTPQMK